MNPIPMSKLRKFNIEKFFKSFQGHEDELSSVFDAHKVTTESGEFSLDGAKAILRGDSEPIDRLAADLYQINDLAGHKGREMMELACDRASLPHPVGVASEPLHYRAL